MQYYYSFIKQLLKYAGFKKRKKKKEKCYYIVIYSCFSNC